MKSILLAFALTMTTLHALAQSPSLPPVAEREPKDVTVHGDPRIDDWFWLRQRDDPRTLPYLKAENAYADSWFGARAAQKEKLYQEMLSRVQQDDEAVPYRRGRWWYSSKTVQGRQYPIHLRRAAVGADRHFDSTAKEEVLLDLNEMARGKAYLRIGVQAISPNAQMLAYTADETGGRDFVLHVKNLATGQTLPLALPNVETTAWGNDNRTLYYVTVDATKRAHKLWRRDALAAADAPGSLLYEEKDEQFDLSLRKTLDQRYLVVGSHAKDSSELRVIDASRANAKPRLLAARRDNIDYELDHRGGQFWVIINDTGRNGRLVRVDAKGFDLAKATEVIAHRPDVMLSRVQAFAQHLVVSERAGGNTQLQVFDLKAGTDHRIAFDEAAFTVAAVDNAEFETRSLRFSYTSLVQPTSIWDYDLASRQRTLKKRQPVPGYDAARYVTERIAARAADGTEVPLTLVYRADARVDFKQAGARPTLLYGYGSYGISIDPTFSLARVSLLDRGVVFALAHIRGGGEFGRTWYEAGKLANKMNTFTDFIACAEALVARGVATPQRLVMEGGSAGGLLMGAVTNLRHDLFKAVVAEVPFVDVINTMLDETIPLTTGEFTEWGNPKVAAQYAWMRAYSPYDNLQRGSFPAMFVRTGINDSQVAYWEPAKYVARLRTLKTDANPLLFLTNLEVGHGGSSGRFDALKERAQDFVFMLDQMGIGD